MFDTTAPVLAGIPAPAVVRVQELLTGRAQVDPTALPDSEALAEVRALLAVQAQVEVLLLQRLGDVDARRLHQLDGNPTTTSWLRAQGSALDPATVTLARRLPRLPAVAQAVSGRTLSAAAAERLATALTKLRPLLDRPDGLLDGQPAEECVSAVVVDGVLSLVGQHLGGVPDDDPRFLDLQAQLSEISCWPTSQLARLEAAFVLLAQHLPLAHLPAGLGLLVDALLPDRLEERAARGAADRTLSLRLKDDGSGWTLYGELDLEAGELAHTVLAAARATDPDNPADTAVGERLREAGWRFGDPLPRGLDPDGRPWDPPRSKGQRAHDALKLALRHVLDSGELGTRDKAAPHVGVTVSLRTLHGQPDGAPATSASGARLPLSLVQAWWCDANITRYVLGLGHRVLETSHTERTLKAHERRIKHLETGGHCQGAGCCRGPGQRLVPHHVDAYARCGRTSLRDTVLLCEHDHAALHRGQVLRLKDGRRLNADGWID